MKKFFTMFGLAGLMAGMMMVAGCGDDNAPQVVQKSTVVAATVAGQTATTTAAVSATPAGSAVVALAIPTATAITATGGTMPANPTIVVSTPVNGTTSGVAPAVNGGASFTVVDSKGAVDIAIPGVTSFTVGGAGATVKIPVAVTTGLVDGAVNVPVSAIKANGSVQNYLGTYSAAAATVTVSGVTNFCWFVVSPVFKNASGATGSASTFNLN